ncbi:MAG: hypothetical protein ACD_73C00349G0002 [uncultured bacterium]|nr:MAG: hypothetical protein ACD_73C00349G0002 [uncultured bacterium]
MSAFKIEYTGVVKKIILHLTPSLKPLIKSAIELLPTNPYLGKPLQNELFGLMSYRVKRFRVVYRIMEKTKKIQIIYVGHRKDVYLLMKELLEKTTQ